MILGGQSAWLSRRFPRT